MTTKTSTGYTTELRHCTGSERFGIASHEAPVSTFPKQPSRKDGLGTMCAEHWKAYVKGLAADRKARTSAPASATPAPAAVAKPDQPKAPAKPAANADTIATAEALIAEVDALPGPGHIARVGDDDVQRAFETVAAARGISME